MRKVSRDLPCGTANLANLRRLVALAALALSAPAIAQAPERPKLLIAISVDQLSADLFAQYRPHFTGGLKRLSEGVVFPSGFQSQAATETCPGHSTILTGARPSRSGVIANTWFDPQAKREDKAIYCAEDESVPGSSSKAYTVSAVHLRVPTLGDRMKRAASASRNVAVAGKDRAAVMMGGKAIDQALWWDGKAYVGLKGQRAHPAVTAFNAALARQLASGLPPLTAPALCAAKARAVPIGGDKTVGAGRFGREPGDARAFRASPESDGATLALAMALVEGMKLGQGRAPDMLSIGLSATDYVGHTFGTQGQEMCLQLLSIDADLGAMFDRLDALGIDYAVTLTADHGGLDLPERTREQARPEDARAEAAMMPEAVGTGIGRALGLSGPVLLGDAPFGDIWLDAGVPAGLRRQVLDRAIAAYRAFPLVHAVFDRATLQATSSPRGDPSAWTALQRARASWHPQVSGDLVVLLKPGITPIVDPTGGYVATHGSAWDYDRRVPILFWRKGLAGFEQPLAVETVDIMPTLAALIGLPIVDEIDGRCLDLDGGAGSTCPN